MWGSKRRTLRKDGSGGGPWGPGGAGEGRSGTGGQQGGGKGAGLGRLAVLRTKRKRPSGTLVFWTVKEGPEFAAMLEVPGPQHSGLSSVPGAPDGGRRLSLRC